MGSSVMMRALSTAASGMDAQQTHLDVVANNIANVSTVGFKKVRAEFAEMMVQVSQVPGRVTAEGTNAPVGLEVGLGVRATGTSRFTASGDIRTTEGPLDLAIQGAGYFQLETPSGARIYTRNGQFKTDSEGRLVNNEGLKVTGDLRIPLDAHHVNIGQDGHIEAFLEGEESTPIDVGRLELATFMNPAGLVADGRSNFRETVASGPPVTGSPGEHGMGSLEQRALEQSNVQMVDEMVDLISGQRAYEVNSRVIKAADEMLQQATNLR